MRSPNGDEPSENPAIQSRWASVPPTSPPAAAPVGPPCADAPQGAGAGRLVPDVLQITFGSVIPSQNKEDPAILEIDCPRRNVKDAELVGYTSA